MPEADPFARRLIALDIKLATLTAESAAWRALGSEPASGFAIHRLQITELSESLEAMHGLIRAELGRLREDGVAKITSAQLERLERRILAALHIWESYRSKFAVRVEKDLRDSLRLLDDLAWAAYAPACVAAAASGRLAADSARMPPLVFPSSRWSPFARSREQAYELDESAGVMRDVPDFDQYLRAIPIPLIGIPWYQAGHLPDAVFVGHEVGHIVEEDLALDEDLRAAVSEAMDVRDAGRSQVWSRHWRSEVFADLYGVLATGPAFVRTLADVLRGSPDIATEAQPDALGHWSAYPTRTLRLRLACEVLRSLPDEAGAAGTFAAEADAIDAEWEAAHPLHAMAAFDGDVKLVVQAMLCRPMQAFAASPGGAARPIASALNFTRKMHKAAEADAAQVHERENPKAEDVRTLFASVALAFMKDPERYRSVGAHERFRARLLKLPQRRKENAMKLSSAARRAASVQALFDRVDASPR